MSVDNETPLAPACDFCTGLPAVVYCRADSARLCLPCDRHVHGANTVSTRHARAPLCAACRAAAAAFRRRRFLCVNCDFEEGRQRGGGDPRPLHDRGAVEGYAGCPSVAELAAILGVDGCEKPAAAAGDGWWPSWEEPQVLSLEDVVVPTTSCHGLRPLLTPSSPKNPSSGGKMTEEVIRQLGELAKSELGEPAGAFWASSEYGIGDGDFGAFDTEACHDAAASMPVPCCEQDSDGACRTAHEQATAPASLSAEPCLPSFVDMLEICPSIIVDQSSAGKNVEAEANTPQPAKKGGYDVAYPNRSTVISRYKEKRKNRRFEKQIRYASRKARADGRLRIKGRFARSGETS